MGMSVTERAGAVGRRRLRSALADVVDRPWYAEVFCAGTRGRLPPGYPHLGVLADAGVVDAEGRALQRVNRIGALVFVTDGCWRPDGMFAFTDESELLLGYCRTRGAGPQGSVVDLASGCGHTALAFPGAPARTALDVDARAVEFVRLNAWINDREVEAATNDIRDGLPERLRARDHGRTLFVANMPFGVSPHAGALDLTRDGGDTGIRLSSAVLEAVRPLIGSGARLVMLSYSLGSAVDGRWQLLRRARETLPGTEQTWTLTAGPIWRVDHRKEQPNPMPLRSLRLKADGTAAERERLGAAYDRLADQLRDQGWDHLGCGILDVRL